MTILPDLSLNASAEAELPGYHGISITDVHLIVSPEDAAMALSALRDTDVVGFDTESKPTFSKGEASTGPHLIQLAAGSKVYLFQVKPGIDLKVARMILEAKHILKVGFGLESDTERLKTRLGIESDNVLDLARVLPGSKARKTIGAKAAVAHYFGKRMAKSKRTSTSNWAASRLTERQMLYAANDAQVALYVYRMAFPGESAKS